MAKARYGSLTHEGPLMPEPRVALGYEYNGKKLSAPAEEIIWHWAIRRDTDYVKSATAKRNFVESLKQLAGFELGSTDDPAFKKLVDRMHADNEKIKETKKNKTKETKAAEKLARVELKEKYGFALVDGKKTPINGFMVEAAGPLISRGTDPRLFCYKAATKPSDVTVNLVGATKETVAAMKAKGFKVVSDPSVLWVFKYDVAITGNHPPLRKKVNFGASSELARGQDSAKYGKALELLKKWDAMQKHIEAGCASTDEKRAQSALATYLVQRTGIRVGNERSTDDYADTVGASTLRVEHVALNGNELTLNFEGKDSVPYKNTITVPPFVAKALSRTLSGKATGDRVFNKIESFDVGAFIKEICPEASPKTFRSAIGTAALCETLAASDVGATDAQKKAAFVRANLRVGKILNHQKNVGKNYGDQAKKVDEAVLVSKQRLEAAQKDIEKKEAELTKKLALAEKNGLKDAAENLKERIKRNRERLEKAATRVETLETKKELKEETKQTALGTSLNSYVDCTVVGSWCKNVGLPVDKVYSKSQLDKFSSRIEAVGPDYWKTYLGYLSIAA